MLNAVCWNTVIPGFGSVDREEAAAAEQQQDNFSQSEVRNAFRVAGDSGTMSNFLRPDLILKLRELPKESEYL